MYLAKTIGGIATELVEFETLQRTSLLLTSSPWYGKRGVRGLGYKPCDRYIRRLEEN